LPTLGEGDKDVALAAQMEELKLAASRFGSDPQLIKQRPIYNNDLY